MTTNIDTRVISRSLWETLLAEPETDREAIVGRLAMQLDGYQLSPEARTETARTILQQTTAAIRERVAGALEKLEAVDAATFERLMSVSAPQDAKLKEGPLSGKTLVISGAGPGGLLAALLAAEQGARVHVLDQRADPRQVMFSDERSFNISINAVGLGALGPYREDIEKLGIKAVGRAVHYDAQTTSYYPYGQQPTDHFVSLPREGLIRTLAERAGAHPNIELHFKSQVRSVDGRSGRVQITGSDDVPVALKADLIISGDGTNGVGRDVVGKIPGVSTKKEVISGYLNVRIPAEQVAKHQLSMNHIHFWPCPGGVTIGIPLRDGSVDLLLAGDFKGRPEDPVFANKEEAERDLAARWPTVASLDPDFASRAVGRRRGFFVVTSASRHTFGPHGILIGDAARSMPSWIAYGANASMFDAKSAVEMLVRHKGNVEDMTREYETYQSETAHALRSFALEHSKTIRTQLGSMKWRFKQWWGGLKERYLGSRTLYQRAEMSPDGLRYLREHFKSA